MHNWNHFFLNIIVLVFVFYTHFNFRIYFNTQFIMPVVSVPQVKPTYRVKICLPLNNLKLIRIVEFMAKTIIAMAMLG